MVQWLRLHVSTAGAMGSITGQGPKILRDTWPGQTLKKNMYSQAHIQKYIQFPYLHACRYIHIYILTDTHIFSCILIQHTHPEMYTCALPHSHTHFHRCVHSCIQPPTSLHNHTITHSSLYLHVRTFIHTHLLCPEPPNKFKALDVAQPCQEHPWAFSHYFSGSEAPMVGLPAAFSSFLFSGRCSPPREPWEKPRTSWVGSSLNRFP